MVVKGIEKKVRVVKSPDLFGVPINSWIEINGKDEFKIKSENARVAITLSIEDRYVCKKSYEILLQSLIPFYIEKFLKGTSGAVPYLKKILREGGLL